MSVLNKIPYISALLNSLSAEELQTLLTLMNGGGNRTPIHRTANPIADANVPHISPSDKGVKMCDLTINYTNFVGYLVYTDDCCALISYTDSPVLKVFDIDVSNVGIATVDEAINVLELRTVVWETIHKNGGGGGTEVIANPELEGDENALNSIEINGVKYKVEGSGSGGSGEGTTLYLHSIPLYITVDNPNDGGFILTFLSKHESFNATSLMGLMQAISGSGDTQTIINPQANMGADGWQPISNIVPDNDGVKFSFVLPQHQDNVTFLFSSYSGNQSITDTVTPYIQGGSGGGDGTVEAEPIVKITMTNIDCRELDNDPQALRDIIVYCTKERWDNFVALASSEFSVDFTYQNFATVYPQLTREEQGFVFGYLLMDYYDGKILPNSVMINKDTPMAQYGQIFEMPFNASVTMKNDTTGNIEIVVDGNWGMGTASGAFPIGESNSGTYTTASSVITVEEIAGAAVGSGGGSSEDAGGAHTKYTVTAQYNSNELKLMLYFLCNEEELYSDLNAGFVLLNTRLGISLNTHCASESDIVDNFNILQQIDTTGGSDPDNNALVFGALGLLVRTEKCIKVTMPYIAEFGTDLNSVDVIRSNGQLGGMGLYYVNDSGVNTPINVSAFVGHTGVTYGCNIEEIDASGSGSGSGGSQPATGPTYCYVQVSSDTVSNNIIYMFDRRSADRQDMVDGVNLLITTLNSMFSVSIPSYSSIDDLPTIASYINSLDTANYGTLKVIWWASLFNSFQYLSLSVKLYSTGWVLPVLIFARSDQLNNQYSYGISYIDDINQLQSLWTSNDTFDFSIHVDDLD